MKRFVRVDAQGREDLLEEVRRYNARRREIEEESAERSGRSPSGPVVRAIALPLSDEQAAAVRATGLEDKGSPPSRCPGRYPASSPPSSQHSRRRSPSLVTLLTLHECRHTFASLLIDTGANPKAIQVVMGHSKFRRPLTFTDTCCPGAMTM